MRIAVLEPERGVLREEAVVDLEAPLPTGFAVRDGCRFGDLRTEWFLPGTEPEPCPTWDSGYYPGSNLRPVSGVAVAERDGRAVLLDMNSERYFGLDRVNCMLAMYLMLGPCGARYSCRVRDGGVPDANTPLTPPRGTGREHADGGALVALAPTLLLGRVRVRT